MSKKWESGLMIAIIAYTFLFILDLISTIINGELVQHLESNPLYHIAGFGAVMAANAFVILIFYLWYTKSKSVIMRHTLLFILVLVCVIRCLIIWNNIQVYVNPPPLEAVAAIPAAQKAVMYRNTIWAVVKSGLLMFCPAWLAFWLFYKDHKVDIDG